MEGGGEDPERGKTGAPVDPESDPCRDHGTGLRNRVKHEGTRRYSDTLARPRKGGRSPHAARLVLSPRWKLSMGLLDRVKASQAPGTPGAPGVTNGPAP